MAAAQGDAYETNGTWNSCHCGGGWASVSVHIDESVFSLKGKTGQSSSFVKSSGDGEKFFQDGDGYWAPSDFIHLHPKTLVPLLSSKRVDQSLIVSSLFFYLTGVKHKAASFYVGPVGFKDTWSPFLKEIEEKYPMLLFLRFRIKLMYVVILETFSYV